MLTNYVTCLKFRHHIKDKNYRTHNAYLRDIIAISLATQSICRKQEEWCQSTTKSVWMIKKQAINGNFMQPMTESITSSACHLLKTFCTKPINNTEAQTSIKPTNHYRSCACYLYNTVQWIRLNRWQHNINLTAERKHPNKLA